MSDAGEQQTREGDDFVEIDIADLSPDALRGLVEEFVSREGTDYGRVERGFEEKCADVARQLETGGASIVFDRKLEQVNIVLSRDLATSR